MKKNNHNPLFLNKIIYIICIETIFLKNLENSLSLKDDHKDYEDIP